MQELCIVNASTLLKDEQVEACVVPLQEQVDLDLMPHWQQAGAHPVHITFRRMADIPRIPPDVWPIFLNRSSTEPGALAWHTEEGTLVYGRTYVGDCLAMGLSWQCTLSHEVVETVVNPTATKVWRMPDGRYTSLEVADAVEADKYHYERHGIWLSDFVYPEFFSTRKVAKYDHMGVLRGPCPDMGDGGYLSVTKRGNPNDWGNIYAEHEGRLPGRRAILPGYRRRMVASRIHYQEFSIEAAPPQ